MLFNADGSSFNEKDGIDGLRQLDPTKGKTDKLTDPKLTLLVAFLKKCRIFYHMLINSISLVWVSNIAIVALYPKNQPLAVPGLRTSVLPTFVFCTLCVCP